LVAKRVEVAIAVSRSQLPDLYALGFDPRALRVIYNGIPAPRPAKTREETRAGLGIEPREFVALMVGALRAQKRVPVFIEAVDRAHAANTRIKGLVAGGGLELDALRAGSALLGGNVTLLGERADIPDLIVASDVVCLTSWTEATSIALIEAMALQRPVVAGAVGGNDEVVVDGETGVLVAQPGPSHFASALQALAADGPRALALAMAGKARYERLFSAKTMLDEYARVFTGLVELPPSRDHDAVKGRKVDGESEFS
jgi:glycosyltransferase involved in cell wall biosynthesis